MPSASIVVRGAKTDATVGSESKDYTSVVDEAMAIISQRFSPPQGSGLFKEAIWSAATCRRFKLTIAESIEEGLSAPVQQQVTKSGDKSPHSKLLP